MRLRPFLPGSLAFIAALPCCFCTCGYSQEDVAGSTVRLASATEPAAAPTATQSELGNWGEAELKFELSPTTSAGLPAHPNTAKRSYSVTPASFSAPLATKPLAPPANARSKTIAGVYTNASATATLSKIPRPAPVQRPTAAPPVAHAGHVRGKPFQAVDSGPTVSPYLNLYRNEVNANTMPNYYAFVRPQLDQIEANRKQAADMQRLQAQLQNTQSAGGSQPVMYGTGDTGPAPVARFGDTAQFYQRTRR